MASHEPFDNSAKAFYRKLFEDWGMVVANEKYFLKGEALILSSQVPIKIDCKIQCFPIFAK